MTRGAALTLSILALLAPGVRAGAAQVRAPRGPVLVYEARRPELDVSIIRRGHRLWRASVSAPGRCDNGEEVASGFGLIGGIGWPIDVKGRFHRSAGDQIFRGRFEGDKVVGVFFESGFRVGGSTEVFPPMCGNTRPEGRYQHFVARLVERNHREVPHTPARAR